MYICNGGIEIEFINCQLIVKSCAISVKLFKKALLQVVSAAAAAVKDMLGRSDNGSA